MNKETRNYWLNLAFVVYCFVYFFLIAFPWAFLLCFVFHVSLPFFNVNVTLDHVASSTMFRDCCWWMWLFELGGDPGWTVPLYNELQQPLPKKQSVQRALFLGALAWKTPKNSAFLITVDDIVPYSQEVSHGKSKMIGKRETYASLRCLFLLSRMHWQFLNNR